MDHQFTEEEEIWLLEEMLNKPLHIVLNHLPETTQPSTPSPGTAATPEPYDPTHPGFLRPDRQPTRAQPKEVSQGLFKHKRSKTLIRPVTPSLLKLTGTPSSKARRLEELFGASPTRDTSPKKTSGTGSHDTIINPGPRLKRSPQLIAAPQTTKPVDTVTSNAEPEDPEPAEPAVEPTVEPMDAVVSAAEPVNKKKSVNRPGPRQRRSPQRESQRSREPIVEPVDRWVMPEYPGLEDYPESFSDKPGDLFTSTQISKTPMQTLKESLACLETLQSRPFLPGQKGKRSFSAYDKKGRIWRVTQTRNQPKPTLILTQQRLEDLVGKFE
ncbi:proteoglycan 4-like [Cotesia glomerata]|uniref:proteoglycan 4-like n=1 Tax=Cotesia glomerata TaxID=32391 RepID=UPI001D02D0BD|nr:proteoglycan 4-like [Cotesia glomerata]